LVNLVDEEERAEFQVRQETQHIRRLGQRPSARHLKRSAKLVGKDGGERGLADAGRPIEKDMRHWLLPLSAGVEQDAEAAHEGLLTNDLAKPARAQSIDMLTGVAAIQSSFCHPRISRTVDVSHPQ
jgi:hypothetical protein